MVQPDQNHERSRKALVKLDAVELRRRIDIENYRHPNYVESEVLASLVRARFGKDSEPVKNYKNIRTTWSTVRALVR
ncbi:MAG: hypothetical protein EXR27_15365 [Betaproteobacteria bacterium]|nr:hypothetical protein [Betaproteobacteria bacterium]